MNKENILRITLFVSVLVLNSAIAEKIEPVKNVQTQKTITFVDSISQMLQKKGLDEDAAKEISQTFVTDEVLFSCMVENILKECSHITEDKVLDFLSYSALFRKSVKLNQYDDLIGMMAAIKQKPLDKQMLATLRTIADTNNQLMNDYES